MMESLGYILTGGVAAGLVKILEVLVTHKLKKNGQMCALADARIRDLEAGDMLARKALLALLHDRLYSTCGAYIERSWCSAEDKRNLEYMFLPYEKLGGNGTCKAMYEQCLKLPLHPESEE